MIFVDFWFLGPRGPLGTPLYVRTHVRAKNLDQQYTSMYASLTHITIHILKAHDTDYPLSTQFVTDSDSDTDTDTDNKK